MVGTRSSLLDACSACAEDKAVACWEDALTGDSPSRGLRDEIAEEPCGRKGETAPGGVRLLSIVTSWRDADGEAWEVMSLRKDNGESKCCARDGGEGNPSWPTRGVDADPSPGDDCDVTLGAPLDRRIK